MALPGINPFAQDERRRRDFTLQSGGWDDLWVDAREKVVDDEPDGDPLIGWHSEKTVYTESEWRKKYAEDVVEDQFSPYAIIAYGRNGELTAVGLMSSYLKDLYNAVAYYLPAITLEVDMIIFGQPFQPLYFYLDDMCKRAASMDTTEEEEKHLATLLSFYQKYIEKSHTRIRDKIKQGSIDFNELWALFKPATNIFSKDEWDSPQILRGCASAYREGGREYGHTEDDTDDTMKIVSMALTQNQTKRFCFDCWHVAWDPATRRFSRSLSTHRILNFRGTRKISSLPYYPLEMYLEYNPHEEGFVERIKVRGREWKARVAGGPVTRKYDGPAIELKPGLFVRTTRGDRSNLKDRVIVDNDGNIQMLESWKDELNMQEMFEPMMASMQMFSQKEPPIKPGDFDESNADLDSFDSTKDFNDLQALLCPASLTCFSLAMRKWYTISIDNLSEIAWNNSAWDHLVLDQTTKLTIKTLVANHRVRSKTSDKDIMTGDVIERKGSGLVIVLYGPPGVGKTLTAESVAEYTKRPLYAINVGELTSEDRVRARLQQVFNQASKWNAVLLLDEADVVLEKRSLEDIKRNSTVSVFLQMLEYYEGVLFLTTNRLEHIDNAFQSRINLAYEYPKLRVSDRREIWANFIKSLPEADESAREELERRLDSLATLDINGRQIRNVIFTARSLAQEGATGSTGHFSYQHVKQIIDHTKKLQEFFGRGRQEATMQLGQSATRTPVAWDAP